MPMTHKNSTDNLLPHAQVEDAKNNAIRSLWTAFFLGWLCFSPTMIVTIIHLSQIQGRDYGIIVAFASVLSFLIMTVLQWSFIRGIKKNKKHSITKMGIFLLVFMALSTGNHSSETFTPIMGKAHWIITMSGLGLLLSSLWQLYTLWALRKTMTLYKNTM